MTTVAVRSQRLSERDTLALLFAGAAARAGGAIMRCYADPAPCRMKSDNSPVTDADTLAESLIIESLEQILPGVPVVAEEGASAGRVPVCGSAFVLVDPLDGTQEFMDRSGEFTVNIALIEGGRPVAGCIYVPARGEAFFAGETAAKGYLAPGAPASAMGRSKAIVTRVAPATGLTALVSRRDHDQRTEQFLSRHGVRHCEQVGSALKFARLAEGHADVYPRFTALMEWDVAAGQALVEAAGGAVLGLDGAPLRYGRAGRGFATEPFVAWGQEP